MSQPLLTCLSRRSRGLHRLALVFVVALMALLTGVGVAGAQSLSRETLRDYDIVNGYFYTETGASPNEDQGFSITDEGGVLLWSEFQRLGGVDALGYPVSRRFVWDGFVVQATQKVILQWRPDLGRAVFVNVLDEMTKAGKDEWLTSFRQLPPPSVFEGEAGLSFNQIMQRRLALLDGAPALRTAYFATPNALETNGLPVAPIADVGPALVLRAQRRAFQYWKVATPWARAGDVTVVNAGDLAKEAGLFTPVAAEPEPAWAQIAVPPGSNTQMSSDDVARLRQVIERARPAVVKLSDGTTSTGTGFVIDPSGLILTNSHVVTSIARDRLRATLTDGQSFAAKVLGADEWTDVAVVRIEATNLPHVPLGSARTLTVGQRVLALGYAPLFPGAPSAKTGTVRSLAGEIQVDRSFPLFGLIQSNTFIYPGDSGGPLLDLNGHVVGVNSAIQVAWVPRQGRQLTGYSIPVEGAHSIAQQIISSGSVPRPHIGITPVDVTPSLASSVGLPVNRGVMIVEVRQDSPASRAGLEQGDLIVAMNGEAVTGLAGLRRLMVNHTVGDTVSLTVISPGQPRRTVPITLTERPPLI
ncbi:MAG TPA: trypsin-like peptidase domain-containing protein [Chloroflexota bacterium]|nr:trypsin-like peptidase domain-containing protein [Chloroflexota bacterium]